MVTNLPSWTERNLARHYRIHRREFPELTMQEFAESALEAILNGMEFTYTEEESSEERLGYYVEEANLLSVVDGSGTQLVTHFRPTGGIDYCRALLDSTCPCICW